MSNKAPTFTLHAPRSVRLDVAPFAVLYAIGFGTYLLATPKLAAAANIATPIAAALHILTFLTCHWSLPTRCALQLRRVRRVADATLVRARPAGGGRSVLCELERRAAHGGGATEVRFDFQKRAYVHTPPRTATDDEASTFLELTMPLGLPLSHYLGASKGLKGDALSAATHQYGPNSFAIPGRTFGSLFVEHALAPFFVFQVFCVLLWSLDDYWYYSLFTLVMLVLFESTVVTSRLRNLDEMRELATPPSAALALRDGKWTPLSSEELLPGDIIALARAEPSGLGYTYNGAAAEVETACPADVVLLHGSVTVNESALTGESIPMLKTALDSLSLDEAGGVSVGRDGGGDGGGGGGASASSTALSLTAHRAAVVLGGTRLLQHSPGSQPASLQPPGGGAVGYVVRTGFHSSQGELIRTILFASERASENTMETLVFIAVLLSFALAAATFVLLEGLADPTRSRWKLLLHCTMILTSVVPPELPMELSLAVNNSLLALHRLGIYCTEPFRIPSAGRCHICCFDKTGTLTLSEQIVEGIAVDPNDDLYAQAAGKAGGGGGSRSSVVKAVVGGGGEEGGGSSYRMALAKEAPLGASYVLAGCHQLVSSGGKLLGDPMEKAAIQSAGWVYHADGTAVRDHSIDVDSTAAASTAFAGLAAALPPSAGVRPTLRVLKRFPFSSELKRSSAVVETGVIMSGGGGRGYGVEASSKVASAAAACGAHGCRVLVKGSPEVVRGMLTSVPAGYDAAYLHYASSGKRILALASKLLPHSSADSASAAIAAGKMRRDEAECGLAFCGFLVLHCPARPKSKEVLHALSASGHTLQMLTGDSLLTATHTATDLGLATKPALLLEVEQLDDKAVAEPATPKATAAAGSSGERTPIEKYISKRMQRAPLAARAPAGGSSGGGRRLRWVPWQAASGGGGAASVGAPLFEYEPRSFRELARRFDLCVGGDGFAALEEHGALKGAMPFLRVLARMSPGQKETALATHRECGLVTMMCGDGTNDVGALKQSAVSIALVSASLVAPPPPKAAAAAADAAAGKGGGKRGKADKAETVAERQQRRLQERMAQEMASAPAVKLGDASIAAAFTARSACVSSCVDVVTQGRCTLVTTTQMFKILSLNCLISAYALSVLHHKGVRMSDTQATATGLATAALFLFVSFSQPLTKLAPRRPPPSALAPSVVISVAGQFAVHLYSIIAGFRLGQSAAASAAEPPPEADAEFEPTVTNTVLFLLSSSMLVTTFAANYTGKPYMASLSSNRGLCATLTISMLLLVLLTTGQLPDVAAYLELLPLPKAEAQPGGGEAADLGSDLLSLMTTDFLLCIGIEKFVAKLFRY